MNKNIAAAHDSLDVSQKIYQVQTRVNPSAIFGDKKFLIDTESDQEVIGAEKDYETKDRSYYFETPEIEGVIIKRQSGNYCVKAAVKYINNNKQEMWFAKIRIEKSSDGDIQVMGTWSGSWQQRDWYDKNLIEKPNPDLPIALDSMKNYLVDIYSRLDENEEVNSEAYDPHWVKKLKPYNS